MISLSLAQKLKKAGLSWRPVMNDFFAVSERGMDDRIFVIDNMPATIERLFGKPVVAFQGSSEWALDYLLATEATWMPRDDQMLERLVEMLGSRDGAALSLSWSPQGYRCEVAFDGDQHRFDGLTSGDATGEALLYMLENAQVSSENKVA